MAQLIRRGRAALQFDIAELPVQRDGLSANIEFAFETVPVQIEIYCRCDQILGVSAQNHFHAFARVLGRTKNCQSNRQGSFDVKFENRTDFDGNEICTGDADRHKGLLHE